MEQVIISMLGVLIVLMLYLDRSRRVDLVSHANQTDAEFARVHQRFDQLTDLLVDLARRVGRLEGRAESQAEATDDR